MIRVSARLILSNSGGIFEKEKYPIIPLASPRAAKGRKGNMILLSIKRNNYKLDLYSRMDREFIQEILRDLLWLIFVI